MNWSWLLTLICPLMMIFMMLVMHGGHSHNRNNGKERSLEKEMEQLRQENETIRRELAQLQHKET